MKEIPIGQLAKVLGASVSETVRAIKVALFSGVIRDTRVDTGRLRGNWQTNVGSPSTGTVNRVDRSGSSAVAEATQTVTTDNIDYLTNNLIYAEVWEERDGMIAKNVARIDRIVREKIK